MAITPFWNLIRTFVGVAAEGHAAAPADGAFVQAPEDHAVDLLVSFTGGTFANAPNSGTFWIWTWLDDGTLSIKEKFAEVIVAGAESGFMMPVIIRPGPAKIAITIDSFNGGAVPTFSGSIYMRRIHK